MADGEVTMNVAKETASAAAGVADTTLASSFFIRSLCEYQASHLQHSLPWLSRSACLPACLPACYAVSSDSFITRAPDGRTDVVLIRFHRCEIVLSSSSSIAAAAAATVDAAVAVVYDTSRCARLLTGVFTSL